MKRKYSSGFVTFFCEYITYYLGKLIGGGIALCRNGKIEVGATRKITDINELYLFGKETSPGNIGHDRNAESHFNVFTYVIGIVGLYRYIGCEAAF